MTSLQAWRSWSSSWVSRADCCSGEDGGTRTAASRSAWAADETERFIINLTSRGHQCTSILAPRVLCRKTTKCGHPVPQLLLPLRLPSAKAPFGFGELQNVPWCACAKGLKPIPAVLSAEAALWNSAGVHYYGSQLHTCCVHSGDVHCTTSTHCISNMYIAGLVLQVLYQFSSKDRFPEVGLPAFLYVLTAIWPKSQIFPMRHGGESSCLSVNSSYSMYT